MRNLSVALISPVTRLLVLGGSAFVGRALVDDALWQAAPMRG
jgi:hypothetical protein